MSRSCWVCCLAAVLAAAPVAEGNPFESFLKSRLRRSKPDTVGDPKGSPDPGQFQRKTQAPLIWLKYTKTEIPEPEANWHNTPFKDFAKQAVGAMKAESQNSGFSSEAALLENGPGKPAAPIFLASAADAKARASPSETAATLLMDAEMTMEARKRGPNGRHRRPPIMSRRPRPRKRPLQQHVFK